MNKEIFRLAIPNIISNITIPLLGLVDMYIVGHLDSADYISAIALATMIFNCLFWSFAFLRMGTSGFTAQAYGANNEQEQITILARSLLVALAAGLVIVSLQSVIGSIGFAMLDGKSQAKEFAFSYFSIYIWSAPAVFVMYAFNGWFVGMQNSQTPMYIAISINIVNIILNFICVYLLQMKIEGVAIASVCAQYAGVALSVISWQLKYGKLKSKININSIKNVSAYIPFFKVNGDIFVRTMAMIVVTTFFISTSAKYGENIIAINALLMQTFLFFSYFMDGFAYAAEAITGKLIGAKNKIDLKNAISLLFKWGFLISLLFTAIYGISINHILSFLTDKEGIIALSKPFQIWTLLIPVVSFAAFLWDGIYIGATASRGMRNSMLIASATFFIAYFLLDKTMGNNALWIAFVIYLSIRSIMQTLMAPKVLNI